MSAPKQQATGPRTPEGKARSSQNARKHGLTTREVFVRPEEQSDFAAFLEDFQTTLQPSGILEQTLSNQIVHAAWNLRRVHALEAELMADLTEQNELKLDRVARYARRFENTILRCTRELRALQSTRAARAAIEEEVPAEAPLADPVQTQRAKRTLWQSETERSRALIGEIDLECAVLAGQVPEPLLLDGVPRLAKTA